MTKAEAARLNGKKGGRPRKHPRPEAADGATTGVETAKSNEQKRIGEGRPGPGRPKGVPNKGTQEAKRVAEAILSDPKYLKQLKARALAGKLHPTVETMLWHYRSGKPKDTTVLENPNGSPVKPIVQIYLPDNGRGREADHA